MLTAKNITYYRQQTCLFKNLNFELKEGGLLVIQGENGSGKSTLLNIIANLISPTAGEIIWQDNNYKDSISYVGHKNGLKLNLSLNENLQLSQKLHQAPIINLSYLHDLGLTIHQNQLTRTLSAGQKRKLALLKLFLSNKKLWIVDEPLTALDNSAQTYFILRLTEHLHSGGMAVVSSHHAIAVEHQVLRLSA